jgi:hypothetical protein
LESHEQSEVLVRVGRLKKSKVKLSRYAP